MTLNQLRGTLLLLDFHESINKRRYQLGHLIIYFVDDTIDVVYATANLLLNGTPEEVLKVIEEYL